VAIHNGKKVIYDHETPLYL